MPSSPRPKLRMTLPLLLGLQGPSRSTFLLLLLWVMAMLRMYRPRLSLARPFLFLCHVFPPHGSVVACRRCSLHVPPIPGYPHVSFRLDCFISMFSASLRLFCASLASLMLFCSLMKVSFHALFSCSLGLLSYLFINEITRLEC